MTRITGVCVRVLVTLDQAPSKLGVVLSLVFSMGPQEGPTSTRRCFHGLSDF